MDKEVAAIVNKFLKDSMGPVDVLIGNLTELLSTAKHSSAAASAIEALFMFNQQKQVFTEGIKETQEIIDRDE